MRARWFGSILATAVVITGATAGVAWASPGPGTYTRITSPSPITYHYNSVTPSANTIQLSGVTSGDVTSVDIVCVSEASTGPQVKVLASSVPVNSGKFATVGTISGFPTTCRLRAIPSGTSDDSYLGSFSGPLLQAYTFERSSTAGVPTGYATLSTQGDGLAVVTDAGTCGAEILLTISLPSATLYTTPTGANCSFALVPQNVTANGATTASSIQVDGHNAYLPAAVGGLLSSSLAAGTKPPKLTTTFARAANGDLTITESATLQRCSKADTYPPTTASCPGLLSTGVVFTRTASIIRGAHQVRMRDAFSSTGAAHSLSVQYFNVVSPPKTGGAGFIVPGHGRTFVGAKSGEAMTGLGTRSASILARSDRFASADEPSADTSALTWSKAPSKIQFGKPATVFGLNYSLSVPAHGAAFLGFAASERATTSAVSTLATAATADMITAPTITAPANHATVKGRTILVKGAVVRGANGLPIKVTVSGHPAKLSRVNATRSTWSVAVSQPFGVHVLKVVVTDNAGNTATRAITVRNVQR